MRGSLALGMEVPLTGFGFDASVRDFRIVRVFCRLGVEVLGILGSEGLVRDGMFNVKPRAHPEQTQPIAPSSLNPDSQNLKPKLHALKAPLD